MEVYLPRYIYWELSNYCNLRCKHCFAHAEGDQSTNVNELKIRDKLEEMIGYNTFSVRFGGGEPLMVPYIFNLVEYCSNNGISVDITTNGTLLSTEVLSKLSSAGLRELTISIDGLEETHDLIRGKGMFNCSLSAVKNLRSYDKLNFSIAFTVTALNYNQIELFVDQMVELGVTKFYFFRYCSNVNSKYLELSPQALDYASYSIYKVSKKYRQLAFICEGFGFYTKRWDDGQQINEGCNFLKNVMSIDYLGNVVVCAAINRILGNVYSDDLKKLYSTIELEQKEVCAIPSVCEVCLYSKVCHGGCKSHSYLTYNSYQHKDIYCFTEKNY